MSDVFAAISDYKAKQKLAKELLTQKEEVSTEARRLSALYEKAARDLYNTEQGLLKALRQDA